ncbi:MAG TPA: hypothetical protein VLC28_08475 [Flavitalea sp.]|nr:hypothetical protein [Flavitalea sp.]
MFIKKILPVALAFGTAWAARGQIGHEYGAAWAGGIGVLAMIAVSGRADWYRRLPVIVALGAIGWGVTGCVSYGKVVGYGHMGDYINTSYGLLMLLLIGALYGFIGGGLTGLALESSDQKKPDWAALITQLTAGGLLGWGLLIYELEWLMTPPRSELWAACLGAAAALGWYLYRNGYTNALRTAWFSALGAGFGFAMGNFLQRMGNTSGIHFNWWNVMEYSIGFCAGTGMAYGIFKGANWPAESSQPDKMSNRFGWIFMVAILPAIVLFEGAGLKTMTDTARVLGVPDQAGFAFTWQVVMWIMSGIIALILSRYYTGLVSKFPTQSRVGILTIVYLCWYVLISNFISATWLTPAFSSQHLYWVNILVIFFLLRKHGAVVHVDHQVSYTKPMIKYWATAIAVVIILSVVAVQIGKVNKHTEGRWETKEAFIP